MNPCRLGLGWDVGLQRKGANTGRHYPWRPCTSNCSKPSGNCSRRSRLSTYSWLKSSAVVKHLMRRPLARLSPTKSMLQTSLMARHSCNGTRSSFGAACRSGQAADASAAHGAYSGVAPQDGPGPLYQHIPRAQKQLLRATPAGPPRAGRGIGCGANPRPQVSFTCLPTPKVAAITGHGDPASLLPYIDLAWEELGAFNRVEVAQRMEAVVDSTITRLISLISDTRRRNSSPSVVVNEAVAALEALRNDLQGAVVASMPKQ